MAMIVKVLGAGQHVGKSANVINLNNVNILLDCGIQITRRGPERFPDLPSLFSGVPGTGCSGTGAGTTSNNPTEAVTQPPWKRQKLETPPAEQYGEPNLKMSRKSYRCDIDAVLITHFHLDHIGALPHLTEVLGYDGPIYMTEATLALSRLLLHDCWAPRFQPQPFASSSAPVYSDIEIEEGEDDGSYFDLPSAHSHHSNSPLPFPGSCDQQFPRSVTRNSFLRTPDPQTHRSPSYQSGRTSPSGQRTPAFFGDVPITSQMVESCLARVTPVPLNVPIRLGPSQIHLTALNAGHVVGAVMFFLEDRESGNTVLYTGDLTTSGEKMFNSAMVITL